MERNTWTRPRQETTSPLGQRNSLFIQLTLQVHINLSPVTWTCPWCQLSVHRPRPDTSPCCLWRVTNRGLSQPTAGTVKFTAPRISPSLDTCGSRPYQVVYIPECSALIGKSSFICRCCTKIHTTQLWVYQVSATVSTYRTNSIIVWLKN